MTISVQVSTNIDRNTKEADKLYTLNAQRHINRIANTFRNEILKSMQMTPKTGLEYEKNDGKIHIASSEGNPPAIDTGRLASSVRISPATGFSGKVMSAKVSTNVEYAERLELYMNRPFMSKESQAYVYTVFFAKKIQSQISIKSQFRPVKVRSTKKGISIK